MFTFCFYFYRLGDFVLRHQELKDHGKFLLHSHVNWKQIVAVTFGSNIKND